MRSRNISSKDYAVLHGPPRRSSGVKLVQIEDTAGK
jgi:hypothetical protein